MSFQFLIQTSNGSDEHEKHENIYVSVQVLFIINKVLNLEHHSDNLSQYHWRSLKNDDLANSD